MKSLVIGVLMAVVFLAGCTSHYDYAIQGYKDIESKNYDSAIRNFETAVNMAPSDASFHLGLGQAYSEKGWYKDAIIHIKRGMELQPNEYVSSRLMLADAYEKNQQYQDAIATLKKVTELQPDVANYYNQLGLAYYSNRQYRNAVAAFKKAIAIKPTDGGLFGNLGHCYIELQNYDEAITALKRAIELKPDNNTAYNNLGYAYGEKKQYDKAFKAFRKAMELDPQSAITPSNYGFFLMEKGDYAEAERQCRRAVSLQPNNVDYLLKLSHAYYLQGKYNEALDAADKSVNLSTFTGIGANLHIVGGFPGIESVFKSGPAKEAGLQAGDRIIRVDGKRTKGWKIAEVVSSLRGQEDTRVVLTIKRENVKESFDKTLARARLYLSGASSPIAYRSLIQRHRGKLEEALKDAELAYGLDSSVELAQLALGAAYLDHGRYDETIKLLPQVKDSATARLLEATAYAKQGSFKKAVAIYSAIPEGKLSPKHVPRWSDRAALLEELKPFAASKKENAGTLRAQGRYREALAELGDVLRVADDAEGREVYKTMAEILRAEPQLARVPEEARKYRLRGDVLMEEVNFKEAAEQYRRAVNAAPYIAKLHFNIGIVYGELKIYPSAIRSMKTYLLLAPEAPKVRAVQDQIYKWEFKMEKGE